VSGTGEGACNYWGCRSTYSFGGPTFHMKVEYGNDGKFTITRDGQQISGDSLDPPASGNDWGIVKSTYESKGGVIYSSQWTGNWVPADFCGGGPGDLDGSHFSISNLRISGSVVQGPEPQKCSGPQPSPTPSPPSPSPSAQCNLNPGKNNDGTNLKSSADITGSAEECCSKCSSTSGCVGFTWVHDNQECWMKSAVDSPRDDECGGCVTSGTVNTPPPTPPAPTPPAPTPTPHPGPSPTPSPSACTCGCTGDDLKDCVAACPSDKFTECVQTCNSPCAPTPSPPPSSCTCGCTGDDLKACVQACPDDKFTECVQTCNSPCPSSCTGGDDGKSLHDCVSGCPSDSFKDCIDCCTDKFPSATLV
jgi:hypothetical protein